MPPTEQTALDAAVASQAAGVAGPVRVAGRPRSVVRLVEETPWRWRIDRSGAMRVPGIVFASRDLLPDVAGDRSLEQVVNVATLPGIVGASFAMPDVHWGYGFPIGGVAATDIENHGVVSPGGVGFDISCGVRLLLSPLERTGSRGLGHQVCTDHVKRMESAMARYGISVPDRQLACVPVRSPEGEAYLATMAAAANYGRANRQLLSVAARRAFARTVGTDRLDLLYDVSNLAKLETHMVDGRPRLLCVHRKGATRALPPGHPDLPPDLMSVGQPVLVPGSMGTASYVLVGEPGGEAFHSTCHGAGRAMSRTAARKRTSGAALRRELAAAGIEVRAGSNRGLAEEAPFSYKDVDAVVERVERAGLARRVARLVPIGVIKG